jgi:hypothetical protein
MGCNLDVKQTSVKERAAQPPTALVFCSIALCCCSVEQRPVRHAQMEPDPSVQELNYSPSPPPRPFPLPNVLCRQSSGLREANEELARQTEALQGRQQQLERSAESLQQENANLLQQVRQAPQPHFSPAICMPAGAAGPASEAVC